MRSQIHKLQKVFKPSTGKGSVVPLVKVQEDGAAGSETAILASASVFLGDHGESIQGATPPLPPHWVRLEHLT